MIKVKITIFSLFYFLLACSFASATTFTARPCQDASLLHGDNQQARTNYGTSQYLMMTSENSDMAIIQFDLGAIPTTAVIESATLQLYAEAGILGACFATYRNMTAWDEDTVTWDTRPTCSNTDNWIYLRFISPENQIDLTDYVTKWITWGYSNEGITLTTRYFDLLDGEPYPDIAPTIYSREYSDVSLQPLLTINYHMPEVPEPSSILALLCGIAGTGMVRCFKRK